MSPGMRPNTTAIRIWDLPLRLFHWALVACLVGSLVTVNLGGNWMVWHMRFGYAILSLVLFRIVWGFVGSRYARFTEFVSGPSRVMGYLRGAPGLGVSPGHSPLGSLSVIALILLLLVQAVLGLFANDDIFTEGPLARHISKETSDALTGWHQRNGLAVFALAALHVGAIAFYRFFRGQRLVRAMIGADKFVGSDAAVEPTTPPADDGPAMRLRALAVGLACAAAVWYVVSGP
jgi:cytochrome b